MREVSYNILTQYGMPAKYLSHTFPIKHGLKQKKMLHCQCFPCLLYNTPLGRLKPNGTHQVLVYADVNLLDKRIYNIKKNKEALLVNSKELVWKYVRKCCEKEVYTRLMINMQDKITT